MTTINISNYIVRNNGKIDHEATLTKFAMDLQKYETETETENETIAKAVNAAFDQFPTKRIPMAALKNGALQILGATIANYSVLDEKVQAFIQSNNGEKGEALFGISRGKGGGVCRWDTYVEPEKK